MPVNVYSPKPPLSLLLENILNMLEIWSFAVSITPNKKTPEIKMIDMICTESITYLLTIYYSSARISI